MSHSPVDTRCPLLGAIAEIGITQVTRARPTSFCDVEAPAGVTVSSILSAEEFLAQPILHFVRHMADYIAFGFVAACYRSFRLQIFADVSDRRRDTVGRLLRIMLVHAAMRVAGDLKILEGVVHDRLATATVRVVLEQISIYRLAKRFNALGTNLAPKVAVTTLLDLSSAGVSTSLAVDGGVLLG